MSELASILNYVQLTPDVGTSGQPTAPQFAAIAAAGCVAVVNLAMHDSDGAVPDEGRIVASLGMAYVHLPVDFAAPTQTHLRTFCELMRAFEGRQVWVHCAMNLRVSAFMYRYLQDVRGYSPERARSPLIDAWAPRMDAVWRAFIDTPLDAAGDTGTADAGADDPAERVLEHAVLEVVPGQESEFAGAFRDARRIIEAMPGFLGLRLERSLETPNRHLLLVEWRRLDDHTRGFRGSDDYHAWRELLHRFYEPMPLVEHYQPIDHPQWQA